MSSYRRDECQFEEKILKQLNIHLHEDMLDVQMLKTDVFD
jgi:hypothetical protein